LARQSVAVLRGTPALMAFPVVSGAVTLALTVSFFVPIALFALHKQGEHVVLDAVAYVPMAIFYLLSYFVVIFFNVGLASCTYASMRGERPTFRDGVRFAAGRMGPILGWTLLSATIGLVLQMVSERVEIVGKIIVGLIGAAWNVVTYLVVPVVAVEGKGPVEALKESTALLNRTWGEQLIGNGGVSLVFGVAALVPIVPFVAACLTGYTPAIVAVLGLAVVYWLALAVVGASVAGVYRTALYVYATTGAPPAGFDAGAISSAFAARKQGRVERFFRNR